MLEKQRVWDDWSKSIVQFVKEIRTEKNFLLHARVVTWDRPYVTSNCVLSSSVKRTATCFTCCGCTMVFINNLMLHHGTLPFRLSHWHHQLKLVFQMQFRRFPWLTVPLPYSVRLTKLSSCRLFYMVVKVGHSHWGRNVGWRFSRIKCWGGYLGPRGMR
jgi:hypothetical protein